MKRRLTYALAGLALLLSVAAGAVAAEIDRAAGLATTINGTMEVIEDAAPALPAVAGFNTRAGGTEVSISHPLPITPGVVLAGFNSTKMSTEIIY